MEQDKFALVEKIIKDVHNVLTKIVELYAFDVVPVDNNNRNKSPVLHLENCLGLESWCVKHVYMYCYSELMDKYCKKPKRKSRKIGFNCDRLIKLLNITLLLNPEINSLWNKRREIVLQLLLDKTEEMYFTRLVLSRKPKCNEAFAYRRWLLDSLLKDNVLYVENISRIVNDELIICDLASEKSPNNYHSWNHRTWLLKTLRTNKSSFSIDFLTIKEYIFAEKWTAKHVSDFSCFHYYQFCIKNVFNLNDESWKSFQYSLNIDLRKVLVSVLAANFPKDATIQASEENLLSYTAENLMKLLLAYNNKNCKCNVDYEHLCRKVEILFHALVVNDELVRFYKQHETLWYHRRFILREMFEILYNHFGLIRHNGVLVKENCKKCNLDDLCQKQAKIVRYDSSHIYSSVFFSVILMHEKKIIDSRRKNDSYADQHQKYLKHVEGLNI